jgi:hypothetical protein
MTHPARYAITFLGNGIVRLPRAGIFQTGTRAVVDETVARIAVAHGGFQVIALTQDAPVVQAQPAPQAAAAAAPRPRRSQRMSAVVRSEASSAADSKTSDAHTR